MGESLYHCNRVGVKLISTTDLIIQLVSFKLIFLLHINVISFPSYLHATVCIHYIIDKTSQKSV